MDRAWVAALFDRDAQGMGAEPGTHRSGVAEEETMGAAAGDHGSGVRAGGREVAEKEVGDTGKDIPSEGAGGSPRAIREGGQSRRSGRRNRQGLGARGRRRLAWARPTIHGGVMARSDSSWCGPAQR